MRAFKIKVCGITRAEDANAAIESGADLIGMIFYKASPRFVAEDAAAAIVASISDKSLTVGVFVNDDLSRVKELAKTLPLDMVQLHGEESKQDVKTLQDTGLKVIQAFSISNVDNYIQVLDSSADYVLLDNRVGDKQGGTGRTFDWTITPPRPIHNLMLAGGINRENVAEGVARFQPAIVDVNSGVESEPGIKSVDKLAQFFEECNRIRHGR